MDEDQIELQYEETMNDPNSTLEQRQLIMARINEYYNQSVPKVFFKPTEDQE